MGEKPNLSIVTPSAATGAAATQWWCPLCGTTAEKLSGSESCTCLAHGYPVAMLEVLENQPLPETPTSIGMESGLTSGPLGGFRPYRGIGGLNRVISDAVSDPEITLRAMHKQTTKGWRVDETSVTMKFSPGAGLDYERSRQLFQMAMRDAYEDAMAEMHLRNADDALDKDGE